MLEVLLLCSSLLVAIVVFFIVVVVSFKQWIMKRDKQMDEKITELKKSIDQTQHLFAHDIKNVLAEFKKILNK